MSTASLNSTTIQPASTPPWSVPQVRTSCWIASSLWPLLLLMARPDLLDSTATFADLARFPAILLVATVLIAAITDTFWRKIPNWLTYPMFVWALVGATVQGITWVRNLIGWTPDFEPAWFSPQHLTTALAGALLAGLVMLFIYTLASGGAGDVKLAIVIGACVGPSLVLPILITTYILAAMGTGLWLTWTVGPRQLIGTFVRRVGRIVVPLWTPPSTEQEQKLLLQPVALGPFFCLGTCLTLWNAERGLPWWS